MPDSNIVEFAQSHRTLPPGARLIRQASIDEVLEVSIYLKPRTPFSSSATEPGESTRTTREDLHARRASDHADDIRRVSDFAAQNGLAVTEVHPGRRLIKLSGSIGNLQTAFGTSLAIYNDGEKEFRGRTGSLRIPREISEIVESINGLDNREAAQPQFIRADQVLQPAAITGHLPNAIGKFYGFPSTVTGAGQCIAILELGGGYNTADTTAAFSAMGIPTPTVVSVGIDGAQNSPGNSADSEVALDIQVAGATAPDARLAVYFAPNTFQGFIDAVSGAILDTVNKPSTISISWGGTESSWTQMARQSMDSQFQDAANLGISVFVASGDHLGTNGVNDGNAHVQYPASSPFVIGCGGTSINTNAGAITSEIVWNDGSTGTGGGISSLYPVPAYQQGANLPVSVNNRQAGRGVPDVAADAAPGSGYSLILNGSPITLGGTSAVAPLWAGLTALLNEAAGHSIGFFLPSIYQNPQLCRVITQGNNKPGGSNLGYGATNGWSACTGLGVPDGNALYSFFKAAPNPKPSLVSSVVARQQLRDSINADIAKRVARHQVNVANVLAAAPAVMPLALLAHGDSWFNYPLNGNSVSLSDTDIIAQLPGLGTPAPLICNISHFGDATTVEMSLPKQQRLITALQTPANWLVGGKPDAILFSGGGDDIVGDTFCVFLNYATSGASGLNTKRLDEGLGMVEACYQDLFAFRDKNAPGVPIFGHCYDFPIPNGKAPACAGPWLQPSLNFCGWTNVVEATAIVHQALIEFKNVLQSLATDPANNFILIDTQGTLLPPDWANELHPYPPGFKKLAALFAAALSTQFPSRFALTPNPAAQELHVS